MKKLLFKIIAFFISLFTAAAIGTVILGGTYLLKEINGWGFNGEVAEDLIREKRCC
tara:strand:- start:444 stop:611 length:168 start_codon:yes stop_codon:yes gene_type:complete